ncbi:MAG: 1-acyl-sn-glycerol-3-phosphate acyltransferase [Methylococcales bacterium]|jgi:1-acyl-sn-glycerol-3-phosphate acyltransferase|nr:1-acyl-sn-glycerol-3-phosphate acyltransferase [Methylococcales bacterium]MBT7445390.1 1-acyl-sn-glycerol-3-phosphate acyltransferase [Methylococcales bacterium]
MLFLRSLLYKIVFHFSNFLIPSLVILSFAFPLRFRIGVARYWGTMNLFALKYLCNLTYEVKGLDNVGNETVVFAGKHQSTWETLSFTNIFPPFVWVLKKELLKVPVFGWCLSQLGTIAIDRSQGLKAINQITQEGKVILDQELSIFVFPEGTRTIAREKGNYGVGGTILAKKNKAKIIPVAHNAGEFWPRSTFLVKPGVIQVSVGPAIETQGRKLAEVNQEVEDWIENEMLKINQNFDKQYPEKYTTPLHQISE